MTESQQDKIVIEKERESVFDLIELADCGERKQLRVAGREDDDEETKPIECVECVTFDRTIGFSR
jgi:hypothetical protein